MDQRSLRSEDDYIEIFPEVSAVLNADVKELFTGDLDDLLDLVEETGVTINFSRKKYILKGSLQQIQDAELIIRKNLGMSFPEHDLRGHDYVSLPHLPTSGRSAVASWLRQRDAGMTQSHCGDFTHMAGSSRTGSVYSTSTSTDNATQTQPSTTTDKPAQEVKKVPATTTTTTTRSSSIASSSAASSDASDSSDVEQSDEENEEQKDGKKEGIKEDAPKDGSKSGVKAEPQHLTLQELSEATDLSQNVPSDGPSEVNLDLKEDDGEVQTGENVFFASNSSKSNESKPKTDNTEVAKLKEKDIDIVKKEENLEKGEPSEISSPGKIRGKAVLKPKPLKNPSETSTADENKESTQSVSKASPAIKFPERRPIDQNETDDLPDDNDWEISEKEPLDTVSPPSVREKDPQQVTSSSEEDEDLEMKKIEELASAQEDPTYKPEKHTGMRSPTPPVEVQKEEMMMDSDLWDYIEKVHSSDLRKIQSDYGVDLERERQDAFMKVTIIAQTDKSEVSFAQQELIMLHNNTQRSVWEFRFSTPREMKIPWEEEEKAVDQVSIIAQHSEAEMIFAQQRLSMLQEEAYQHVYIEIFTLPVPVDTSDAMEAMNAVQGMFRNILVKPGRRNDKFVFLGEEKTARKAKAEFRKLLNIPYIPRGQRGGRRGGRRGGGGGAGVSRSIVDSEFYGENGASGTARRLTNEELFGPDFDPDEPGSMEQIDTEDFDFEGDPIERPVYQNPYYEEPDTTDTANNMEGTSVDVSEKRNDDDGARIGSSNTHIVTDSNKEIEVAKVNDKKNEDRESERSMNLQTNVSTSQATTLENENDVAAEEREQVLFKGHHSSKDKPSDLAESEKDDLFVRLQRKMLDDAARKRQEELERSKEGNDLAIAEDHFGATSGTKGGDSINAGKSKQDETSLYPKLHKKKLDDGMDELFADVDKKKEEKVDAEVMSDGAKEKKGSWMSANEVQEATASSESAKAKPETSEKKATALPVVKNYGNDKEAAERYLQDLRAARSAKMKKKKKCADKPDKDKEIVPMPIDSKSNLMTVAEDSVGSTRQKTRGNLYDADLDTGTSTITSGSSYRSRGANNGNDRIESQSSIGSTEDSLTSSYTSRYQRSRYLDSGGANNDNDRIESQSSIGSVEDPLPSSYTSRYQRSRYLDAGDGDNQESHSSTNIEPSRRTQYSSYSSANAPDALDQQNSSNDNQSRSSGNGNGNGTTTSSFQPRDNKYQNDMDSRTLLIEHLLAKGTPDAEARLMKLLEGKDEGGNDVPNDPPASGASQLDQTRPEGRRRWNNMWESGERAEIDDAAAASGTSRYPKNDLQRSQISGVSKFKHLSQIASDSTDTENRFGSDSYFSRSGGGIRNTNLGSDLDARGGEDVTSNVIERAKKLLEEDSFDKYNVRARIHAKAADLDDEQDRTDIPKKAKKGCVVKDKVKDADPNASREEKERVIRQKYRRGEIDSDEEFMMMRELARREPDEEELATERSNAMSRSLNLGTSRSSRLDSGSSSYMTQSAYIGKNDSLGSTNLSSFLSRTKKKERRMVGKQPTNGTLNSIVDKKFHLEGHEGEGTLHITIEFRPGKQQVTDQEPGRPYQQARFFLYFPNSSLGKHVASLVEKAFHRRCLFVLQEPEFGDKDVIVYNGFEAKSELDGDNGYPDKDYLTRATQQLEDLGIHQSS